MLSWLVRCSQLCDHSMFVIRRSLPNATTEDHASISISRAIHLVHIGHVRVYISPSRHRIHRRVSIIFSFHTRHVRENVYPIFHPIHRGHVKVNVAFSQSTHDKSERVCHSNNPHSTHQGECLLILPLTSIATSIEFRLMWQEGPHNLFYKQLWQDFDSSMETMTISYFSRRLLRTFWITFFFEISSPCLRTWLTVCFTYVMNWSIDFVFLTNNLSKFLLRVCSLTFHTLVVPC